MPAVRVRTDDLDPATRLIWDAAHERMGQLDLKELLIELQVGIHRAFHQHPQLTVRCLVSALDSCMDEMDELVANLIRDDEEEDADARLN